tara:strand:+ start:20 stop:499 length:480 start_codon:yes stop_codon:yes gene_type:complete
MVVNGCLLDEAYVNYDKKEKKKKNKKENKDIDIDRNFKQSGMIRPNDEDDSLFYPVNKNYYNQERKIFNQEENNNPVIQENNVYDSGENSEINRLLTNKDYQDYLEFQRNRHNYVHQKDIVETFSTVNDNFNDVLIFALFGMIFLIFTDYIYKLGKKSY